MTIDTDTATDTDAPLAGTLPAAGARFSAAGSFLEALGAQDFARLHSLLAPEVHLQALLPRGFDEWHGADDVEAAFTTWFGNTRGFEVVDASVGEVGGRLLLRWRMRVRAERLGAGWFVVEQQAFVDMAGDDAIGHLALVCSGYRPASDHG